MQRWHIHGDNIIECDRALALVAQALRMDVEPTPSAPYAPSFVLRASGRPDIEIVSLAGYGRWGDDIPAVFYRPRPLLGSELKVRGKSL
jgi:hypothetical protein